MNKSKLKWKLVGVSALIAIGLELVCISLLVSGGIFSSLAYAVLFPSLYVGTTFFGNAGAVVAHILVFFEFFIPVFWLFNRKYGHKTP